jgi:adenylylsulfate kinase-like enzyme
MIYILYGQSGSGKTTLANYVADRIRYKPTGNDPFIIDGDEFRGIFDNKKYNKEGRRENIRKANVVVTYLQKTNSGRDIIMSLVNPYEDLRNELKEEFAGQIVEIMLYCSRSLRKEYHTQDFEKGSPDKAINTDESLSESKRKLKKFLSL